MEGAKDYEWEYEEVTDDDEEETESEDEVVDREVARRASLEQERTEEIPLEEQELPDPLSGEPLEATTTKKSSKHKNREVIF